MKALMKSVLFALAAAGLSTVVTAPASAQVFKPRDQTCDNKSTARDKTLRPDTRCMQGGGRSETYNEQQKGSKEEKYADFVKKNPPSYQAYLSGGKTYYQEGRDRNGAPYTIITSPTGTVGYGSASGISFSAASKGGNGSSRGRTSR